MAGSLDAHTPRSYPERNPFPYQGSVTVDSPTTLGTAEALPSPTLLWQPVTSLRKLAQRYLDGYRPSFRGTGFPVVLVGEHGSGKTHTIRYVIGQVEAGQLSGNATVRSCQQIYARAEADDFMQLYRQLMRQVPITVLRDMALRFLGAVSSEIFGKAQGDEEQRDRAARTVQADPATLQGVFDRQVVLEDEARAGQITEVRENVGKEENFQNILPYLLRNDLAGSARSWLIGETLTDEELRMLGVSANITTPGVARWGLRFLATLFGRGGRPLIVYIDQYEKLVVKVDKARTKTLLTENIGVLRAVVDELSKESAMVVLGGNVEAWAELSEIPDLRQRFGNNVIEFPLLTLDEARDLVALYLTLGRYEVLDVWSLDRPDTTSMTLRGHALPIRAIAAAGGRLISASKDSTIKVWNIADGVLQQTLVGHTLGVNAIAVAADGRTIASASDDRDVRIWSLSEGTSRVIGRHDSWVNDVALSRDGRWAVSAGSDAAIRIWDLLATTASPRPPLDAHTDTVWSVAISPSGNVLASASSDGTVRLWTFPACEPIARKQGHTSWVCGVAISPSGKTLASASDDGTVRLWSMEGGTPLKVLTPDATDSALALSPVRGLSWLDDELLLSASIDGTYRTWRVRDGACIAQASRPRSAINPMAFTLSRDGSGTVVSSASERNESVTAPPTPHTLKDAKELHPFTEESIRAILAIGGGNVRRLVQDCAESFQFAAPRRQEITDAVVREALSSKSSQRIDRDIALRKVERLIAARGMTFRRDYPVRQAVADIAVLVGGEPRLLVQVTKPMYSANEVQEALSSVNLIAQARDLPAEIIMVVVGYASPAVTELLVKASHRFLVFDPDTFDDQFAAVLDQVPAAPPAPPPLDLRSIKDELLTSITGALTQLPAIRHAESANVNHAIRQTLGGESSTTGQADQLRSAWRKERKVLEERIREARKKAREEEFVELEKLHARSSVSRMFRVGVAGAGVACLLYAAMILSNRAATSISEVSHLVVWVFQAGPSLYGMLAFLIAGITLLGWSITGSFEVWTILLRDLAGPVTSIEELDRLAHASSVIAPSLVLRSRNPHLRYLAAVGSRSSTPLRALVRAINAEPSRIVRRAFAVAIGKRLDPDVIDEVLGDISAKRTPEVGYAVEIAARADALGRSTMEKLHGPLRALIFIAAPQTPSTVRASYGIGLQYALWADRDQVPPPALPAIAIREALRDLSPFEEPGIGRLSELESIEMIDECYLFFAEQQFYQEQATAS